MKNRFKSSFNIFTLFALLASLLGSAVFATPAYAAGIVVNSNADTITDDGTCTLREAITNANGDSQLYATSGECASGVGTDTITFAANHTITLDGSQLPAVASAIIINGKGATNTIIQASTCNPVTLPGGCIPAGHRVFEVNNSGDLTLDKLTIQHGQCIDLCITGIYVFGGGGIFNNGILNVTNSSFTDNFSELNGGSIYNTGSLTITNTVFSGNTATYYHGGGIYNENGTINVTNSIFSNNSAGSGGAISNMFGHLNITNSTFSNNSVGFSGGGIFNGGILNITNSTFSNNSSDNDSGGIFNSDTLTVRNSSFSGNSALYGEGGGIKNNGTITVTSSTFSDNYAKYGGGGIYNFYALTITNSTLSSNSSDFDGGGIYNNSNGHTTVVNNTFSSNSANNSNGGNIHNDNGSVTLKNTIIADSTSGENCNGTITADGYNLATDNTCGSTTQKTSAEINLGPLVDNGGPTKTMSLLTGSVAIDAGDNSVCPTTDQRGTLRPQGGSCDIGAYEADSNSPTFTDVPSTHWAFNYIESLYNAGITSGCSTSPLMYCPDATVTRAQMAIFILRGMYGSVYIPPVATGTVFVDVPANAFAADWIEQLAFEGITSGCGNGSYCPNATITRAQMAIFLLRGEHGSAYTPPTATGTVFGDVPLGSFAVDWIEQLALEGITSGCGGGNYCPDNSVTRAEMAVFLVRTFGLP